MKTLIFDYYIVIDLEATCSNNSHELPRDKREIIEIGAVLVRSKDFKIEKEYSSFVKPVLSNKLTSFCTELTSITQDQVDSARYFPEVLKDFCSEIGLNNSKMLFCSWGDYDKKQFIHDCAYHNVLYPFGDKHLNLKKQFSINSGVVKEFGLRKALNKKRMNFIGTQHRGLDDAKNIVRLLPFSLSDGLVYDRTS